jgi:cyanate permease
MYELLPIIAGILLSVAAQRLKNRQLKLVIFALGSLIVGFTASSLSGELNVSWWFLAIDIAQVGLAAAFTSLVLARMRTLKRTMTSHRVL